MNCCDYNCTQGRNCPVRSTPSTKPTRASVVLALVYLAAAVIVALDLFVWRVA